MISVNVDTERDYVKCFVVVVSCFAVEIHFISRRSIYSWEERVNWLVYRVNSTDYCYRKILEIIMYESMRV